MKLRSLFISTLAVASPSASASSESVSSTSGPVYKNVATPIEERIRDLLSRMTIADKAAQLLQGDFQNWINTTTNAFNRTGLVQEMKTKAGHFYVGYAIPADWISGGTKQAQEYLLRDTALGIPAFVQSEGIHGFLVANATIFNSPIGQACSFNPDLVQKMAGFIAQESLALGVNQIFGPLADLARELRFGRVEETFGEDPFLAGEMAYSYVKGLQAGNVSAMVKHFAGFSAPEQGISSCRMLAIFKLTCKVSILGLSMEESVNCDLLGCRRSNVLSLTLGLIVSCLHIIHTMAFQQWQMTTR